MRRLMVLALLAASGTRAQQYTAKGELALPDYRRWVYLGSGIGMTYTGNAPNDPPFTNVFVEPAAYESFLKSGTWPDKTVIIAEMRASSTAVSINKGGRVQTAKVIAIEGEVKDAAKGGWAFYGFENSAQKGTLFPKSAPCYSCHEQHAATDNTFVQFYPTLIGVAKKYGTYKER